MRWVARKTRLDRHDEKLHLAALGRDGDVVPWKAFVRKPAKTITVDHAKAGARFNREFIEPGHIFTNRLGDITFWMSDDFAV